MLHYSSPVKIISSIPSFFKSSPSLIKQEIYLDPDMDSKPGESSSTNDVHGGSESTLQLNVKTLDSRIFKFKVDKNMPVSAFKEKIAIESGVPVGQQRIIFRGKVLKDDHLISEYNVENEDTLHLVERQPQPSPESSSGETSTSNDIRGQDFVGGLLNRIGPIAHSIVLGTLNVGDPGEATVPDLSQVIGAVLNTIRINNMTGGLHTGPPVSHGNATEVLQGDTGNENRGGNQSIPWQTFRGPSAHGMQTPFRAAVPLPSLNMPIPDSLSTLVEFLNRMELAFSPTGDQQNLSTTSSNIPTSTIELPRNPHGLPTIEGLSIVLQHAQRLLDEHAVPAISRTAVRLNQEWGSNDPAIREQVQSESIHLGIALQHLGALLLELGRTVLTLNMGQSPADSFVNAGPAVYISPSGPNPIMVQPFPLQTTSLFGGSSGFSMNPVAIGQAGVADLPRNVNIHIHTGATLAPVAYAAGNRNPIGEGMQGQPINAAEPTNFGQAHDLSGSYFTGTAIQSQPIMFSASGDALTGTDVPRSLDSNSIPSMVAEINSQIRNLIHRDENNAQSGPSDGSINQGEFVAYGAGHGDMERAGAMSGETNDMDGHKIPAACHQPDYELSVATEGGSHKSSSTSKQVNDSLDGASDIPIGLGGGGLQPKKRVRHPQAEPKGIDSSSGDGQNQQAQEVGQQVLQSLSTSGNMNPPPSAHSPFDSQNQQAQAVGQQLLQSLASLSTSGNVSRGVGMSPQTVRHNVDGQNDMVDAMSQLLQGPALDGLFAGVSQQTRVGSPDMLRNMLQQFTENPAMRNTVNQIAQQVDNHDIENIVSGLDGGPGGGIDLPRMMQQMMPIVSRALGGISSASDLTPPMLSESRSRRGMTGTNDNPQNQQINLEQVVQRVANDGSSTEVFHSLVDEAANLMGDGSAVENLVNELYSQEGLAQEFMDMFERDVSRRFHDDTES